jgi:hypothetical protein
MRNAPTLFAEEGEKLLKKYSESSTAGIVETIRAAKKTVIPFDAANGETVVDWLQKFGFTKTEATKSYEYALSEEGKVASMWDIVNGVTAYARSVPYTDTRIRLEMRAGKLVC